MSTTYQDGVTPLDAAHMNALQQKVEKGQNSGYPMLSATGFVIAPAGLQFGNGSALDSPANGVIHTASDLKIDGQIYGSQYVRAFAGATNQGVILGYMGGPASAIQFGPDNAWDTNLYRAGAGQLKTDGQISAGQDFCARQGDAANQAILGYVNGNGGLLLGSAQDTKLYRRAAGQMQTEGSLYVLAANSYLGVWEPGDAALRWAMRTDGFSQWGPGNGGQDTNLYRQAAGQLATDTEFWIGQRIWVKESRTGGYAAIMIQNLASDGYAMSVKYGSDGANRLAIGGDGKLYWGNGSGALDTNLYRGAAQRVQTDFDFWAGGNILLGAANNASALYLGGAGDTYIQRTSPGKINVNGVPVSTDQRGHSVYAVPQNTRQIQTITFPTAFATAPIVTVSAGADGDYGPDTNPNITPVAAVLIGSPTTTSFQVQVCNNSNSTTRNVHVWWSAG